MKQYFSKTQSKSPWLWWRQGVEHVDHCMERDSAHDWNHLLRVYRLARHIWEEEERHAHTFVSPEACEQSWQVLAFSSLFHDVVHVAKNSPHRSLASTLAADHAVEWARVHTEFPSPMLEALHHAISAHSYSAGINAHSLEAKILSDADKLDALGAVGIARTFAVSGQLGRQIAHPEDPLGERTERSYDDRVYGVDHFYCKLFALEDKMHTDGGRRLARGRAQFMRTFLAQLDREFDAEL